MSSKPSSAATGAAQLSKLLYSREDAAFSLSLSVREIDRLISEQQLHTRRYGRRILIPAADVQRIANHIIDHDMLQGAASGRR